VAVAAGQVVLAAQIVGALDQMTPGKATATLLPIDLHDRSRLVQEVEAALDAATLTRAKELGRAVSLAALGREVVERL
jgi:hypothetical protein